MAEHYSKWYLQTENQRGVQVPAIKRYVTLADGRRTWERCPVKVYRDLRDKPDALRDFVIRLNNLNPVELRTRHRVEIEHAYIDDHLLGEFLIHLQTKIPNQKNAAKFFTYLKTYFLNFYITKLHIPSPVEWHKNQSIWSQALQNDFKAGIEHDPEEIRIWEKGFIPAASTLREIVNIANRFMLWLHQQRPIEVPPLVFDPLSKAVLKTIEARRELKGLKREKWYIPEGEWKRITDKAPPKILPVITLMWDFGLREAEALGVEAGDVKNGYLLVERQMVALPDPDERVTDILKGKNKRKVPFFFYPKGGKTAPMRALRLTQGVNANLVSPGYLIKLWAELMDKLKMPYHLHDIRRTWITRCFRIRKLLPTDIQLAAGHEDITTTMQYKLDDRELDDETFKPSCR